MNAMRRLERGDVREVLIRARRPDRRRRASRRVSRSGMTYWNVSSFETRLSEWKNPFGSEKSSMSAQNSCVGEPRRQLGAGRPSGDGTHAPARQARPTERTRRPARGAARLIVHCSDAGRRSRLGRRRSPASRPASSRGVDMSPPPRPPPPPPRDDRMNVLCSSSGIDATLRAEVAPDAVLVEVLLDVRQIECADTVAPWSRTYLPTARSAFGPPKLPTTGTSRFRSSRSFRTWNVLLGGQVAAADAGAVGRHHQVARSCHVAAAAAAAAIGRRRVVVDARAVPVEVVVDVLDAVEIVLAERQAVLLRQVIVNAPSGSPCRRPRRSSARPRRRCVISATVLFVGQARPGRFFVNSTRRRSPRDRSTARRAPCTSAACAGCRAGCR